MKANKVLISAIALAALSLSIKGEQKESASSETWELSIKTMDATGIAVTGADISVWDRRVVISPEGKSRSRGEPISRVSTDNSGRATIRFSPGTQLLVGHGSYRPARFLLGIPPKGLRELNVYLLPIIRGMIRVAPQQSPLNVGVASELTPTVKGDLHPMPEREVYPNSSGEFTLNTDITVRSPVSRLIVGAMDLKNNLGAIVSLTHAESQQPVTIALQPLRSLRCAFQLPTGEKYVHVRLCDSYRTTIASYGIPGDQKSSNVASLVLRLPPGSYELNFSKTGTTEELQVPFELKAGDGDFDLGIVKPSQSPLAKLVGDRAPEIDVHSPDNGRKSLADLRGKVVVLYFWGYWCGPCVNGMPELIKTAEQFAGKNIEFVLIHDPSLTDLAELGGKIRFLEENSWAGQRLSLLTVLDSAAPNNPHAGITAERYGIRLWPTTVVIDEATKVVGLANKDTLPDILRRLVR